MASSPPIFATRAAYREQVLSDSLLGGQQVGVVSVDALLNDTQAVRSLISGKLYDSEKLSGAYGGQYVFVPRYGDTRRVEDRGFRVRYISVFRPPESGTYRLRFYGFGESATLASSSSASSVQHACRQIAPELIDLEVRASSVPGELTFTQPFRVSLGSTAGEIISNGGVGVCIVSRDFSQPLMAGEAWCMSAKIPFDDEDETIGVHTCINLALDDFLIADLLPVTASEPADQRDRLIHLADLPVPIHPEDITGYYAPTRWMAEITFRPPSAGSYTLSTVGWNGQMPILSPLAYNADGLAIQTALREVPLWALANVTPQGPASSYVISLDSMYAQWGMLTTFGKIDSVENRRRYDPLAVAIPPYYRGDAEQSTIVDPGYAPGETWFIAYRRRASTRICPQTYPIKADGTFDKAARPILGTQWIDSSSGLQNDLDMAVPTAQEIAEIALKYCYAAIAAASPRGEGDVWAAAAQKQASLAAGKTVFGPVRKRGTQVPQTTGTWSSVGQKGLDFWLP